MLGVDVGKAELHGTWRDPETRRVRWQGAVPTTVAGIQQLLKRWVESEQGTDPRQEPAASRVRGGG